jgi:hypothetical protein
MASLFNIFPVDKARRLCRQPAAAQPVDNIRRREQACRPAKSPRAQGMSGFYTVSTAPGTTTVSFIPSLATGN